MRSPRQRWESWVTRRRIRRFVKGCRERIFPPVLDVGAGYRSNFREVQVKPYHTLDRNPDLEPTYVGDVRNMSMIPDKSYGTVLCTEVLEHVEDPLIALREIHRVLTDTGLLIVTVPFWYPIHEKSYQRDYWRFTPRGLRSLLNQGLFLTTMVESAGSRIRPTGVFAMAWKGEGA